MTGEWLEGYYARASEMAGDGKPAIHFVVRRIGKTKPPVILGVSKKSFSNRITLLCYDKAGLAITNKT